jgi:hypothetical protein
LLTLTLDDRTLIVQVIVDSNFFNALMIAMILMAGVLVGIASFDWMAHHPTVQGLNLFVQSMFTLEAILKISCEGCCPWNYW